MFNQAFHATLQILLFRKGPEDFPYAADGRLDKACTVLGIVATALLFGIVQPLPLAIVDGVVATLVVTLYTRLVLRLRGLEARQQQTRNALLATGSLLMLVMWLPMSMVMPVMTQFLSSVADAQQAAGPDAPPPVITPDQLPQVPLLPGLLLDLLGLWFAASATHVLRHATGIARFAAAMMALLLISNVMVAMVIAGNLLSLILG
ncbi:MAG: hypothetical protein C0434_06430 [Xanthomonadaceae bacterium]|nr:hypothetical protein [Xanthomonadaceae bacterium]